LAVKRCPANSASLPCMMIQSQLYDKQIARGAFALAVHVVSLPNCGE
jgi:hypothetical protein